MIRFFLMLTLLWATPTYAQFPSDQTQTQAVQTLNQVGQHLALDQADYYPGVGLFVGGWAFEKCDSSQGIVDVLLTNVSTNSVTVVTPGVILRGYRYDVQTFAVGVGWCSNGQALNMAMAGVSALLDLSWLGPGDYVAQLRLRNLNGVVSVSSPKVFVK